MKGRSVPAPKQPVVMSALDTVLALDRSYFKENPGEREYRRPYIVGEWPDSNTTPDGTPFTHTLVIKAGDDVRMRCFMTSATSTECANIVYDADTDEALQRVKAFSESTHQAKIEIEPKQQGRRIGRLRSTK